MLGSGFVVATFSRSATPFIVQQRADDPEAGRFYWVQIDGRDDDALSRFVAGAGRFGPFARESSASNIVRLIQSRRILGIWSSAPASAG
jgi:hypothetical protein